MTINKSQKFLEMYLKHLESNKDFRFINENICNFLNTNSKVYLKTKKDGSTLRIFDKESDSLLILNASPNFFEINDVSLSIINGIQKKESTIHYLLCHEDGNKYFLNRISFYDNDKITKDIIEVFKNDELTYKLSYDKNIIHELIVSGDEITMRSSTNNKSDYLKFIIEDGKFKQFKSDKKEFVKSKNNMYNKSYNELKRSL